MEYYNSLIKTPKISIAPMVDKTNRHFRYFTRLMTKEALLYSEMVTAQSILHGDRDYILGFRPEEGAVALQIAASTPEDAYKAVKLADEYPYSEINLNCGCPSDRVSGNLMGAALMSSKELVYEILCAMKEATKKPVTVKHRIGIDGTGIIEKGHGKVIVEGYEDLLEFLHTISRAKVDRYTIHARTAILQGLSPKDNREIPPLDYEMVYRIKETYPHLNIEINGGFKTIESMAEALSKVDGVMIGRVAYEDCYQLAYIDSLWVANKNKEAITRGEIIRSYKDYVLEELENSISIHTLMTPMQSLFQGKRGSRLLRQLLSSSAIRKDNVHQIFHVMLKDMPQDLLWSSSI